MNHRFVLVAFLGLLAALLPSCDSKDQGAQQSGAGAENTRSSRPPREAARGGTRKEFRTALQAAKALEAGPQRDQALATLAREHMQDYPDLADQAIREMAADSPELPALVEAYVASRMTEGFEAALSWAESLDDPGVADLARQVAIASLPEEQVSAAASKWLASRPLVTFGFDATSTALFQRWTGTAPREAADWVFRLPEGEARNAGITTLANQWIMSDSGSAFKWLAEQNASSRREQVTSAMASALINVPEPIREHFLQPADPSIRQEIEAAIAILQPQPESEPEPETESEPAPDTESQEETPVTEETTDETATMDETAEPEEMTEDVEEATSSDEGTEDAQ